MFLQDQENWKCWKWQFKNQCCVFQFPVSTDNLDCVAGVAVQCNEMVPKVVNKAVICHQSKVINSERHVAAHLYFFPGEKTSSGIWLLDFLKIVIFFFGGIRV